jgi:hypothetical protein
MKLIKFSHNRDWGRDWHLQVLFTKQWAFFQGCVSWCRYAGWPYLEINFGTRGLISILFQVHKFGLIIGLFGRAWKL